MKDVTKPVQPTIPNATGECSATATAPTTTDNCAGTITGTTSDALTYTSQGEYTINWTFNDGNGNTETATQKVVVKDVTKPTAVCKPVTITLVNGAASITAASVNDNSSDNCDNNVQLSVSKTSFDCTNIGANTVTLTVTDASGNSSSCDATVTVIGSIPTVSISQGVQSEFTQGGAVILSSTSNETVTYLWSNTATTANINVYASGTYSLTVKNSYGCTETASSTVDYSKANLLSSYTIITTNGTALKSKSEVQKGGVGTFNGKIDVNGNAKITGSETFAKGQSINVTGGSTVDNKIETQLTLTLPYFESNPNCNFECKSKNHNHCDSKCKDKGHNHCKADCKEKSHGHCNNKNCKGHNDVSVGSNASVTLDAEIFGEIAVGKGSTVTFTSGNINIKELKTSENVTIKFTEQCVKIMVCGEVNLKDGNSFNPTGKSVVVYVQDDFEIGSGSTINTSIYSKDEIEVQGTSKNVTNMTGMFIAKSVTSNNTNWNWNTANPSCTNLNKNSMTETDEKGLIDPTQTSFKIYPNPNKGNFGIDIITSQTGLIEINVIDLLGRTVFNKTQDLNGPVFIPVNLPAEANGQYIIRASVNNQIFTKHIMINK